MVRRPDERHATALPNENNNNIITSDQSLCLALQLVTADTRNKKELILSDKIKSSKDLMRRAWKVLYGQLTSSKHALKFS